MSLRHHKMLTQPPSHTHTLSDSEIKQLWSPTSDNTTSEDNQLTLYWHHRLRCAPLRTLHRLTRRGLLPKAILRVRVAPLCASCAFATAHRRGWRTKTNKPSTIRKSHQTRPGDGTSCDHIISQQSGSIPQTSGKLTHQRFWGSILYADHSSDLLFNHLVTGTTSAATLASKHAYERVAREHGVTVKAYHADNLRFNDNNFRGDCVKAGQKLTFCGVGAHHQNSVAESKIKEVCYGARTILLHAKRRWPTVISSVLWPYAIQAIVERHNHLALNEEGLSPLERFSGISEDHLPTEFHTFGCPVFILNAANQSGNIGTPKWEPRSHTGIYLGHSPCHAGSVALVLNLRTGLVSPQSHLIFDDEFSTVKYLSSTDPPPNWLHLIKHNCEKATSDQEELSQRWLYPHLDKTDDTSRRSDPGESQPSLPPASATNINPVSSHNITATSSPPSSTIDTPTHESAGEEDTTDSPFVQLETLGLRRSERIKALPKRTKPYGLLVLAMSAIATATTSAHDLTAKCFQSRIIHYNDFCQRNIDGTTNVMSPLAQAYISSQSNNEVYSLSQMLLQPDKAQFIEAMRVEVASMFAEKIWRRVPEKEMLDHFHQLKREG